MQPSRGGQIQHAGIAAQFQDHAGQIRQPCRFLTNPQRVAELGCFGEKKALRRDAESFADAGGIRQAAFGKSFRRAQP